VVKHAPKTLYAALELAQNLERSLTPAKAGMTRDADRGGVDDDDDDDDYLVSIS
jgi:hypothetical protein